MTKHLFDDLIGTPPDSTVDVGRIVTRERRKAKALQVGMALPAIVALAVIAGITLNGPTAPVRTPVAQPPPASPDLTFRLVADTAQSAQETARQLRQALDEELREAAPDAAWIDGSAPELEYYPNEDVEKSDQMFYGEGAVALDRRRGELRLAIYSVHGVACAGKNCVYPQPRPLWERLREELLGCQPGLDSCVKTTGPRGERVVVKTDSAQQPGDRYRGKWYDVYVELADGRVLGLASSNGIPTREDKVGVPLQAGTPLSTDQASVIATEIGSRIRP